MSTARDLAERGMIAVATWLLSRPFVLHSPGVREHHGPLAGHRTSKVGGFDSTQFDRHHALVLIGEITVDTFFAGWAYHNLGHLRYILAIPAADLYPQIQSRSARTLASPGSDFAREVTWRSR